MAANGGRRSRSRHDVQVGPILGGEQLQALSPPRCPSSCRESVSAALNARCTAPWRLRPGP